MVEDLANRNKPPKVVNIGYRVPLFPKDYDWAEQDRVRAALVRLHKDTSEEVWEELVRRSDDRRYCLTVLDSGDRPWDRTVGDFCGELAFRRLADPVCKHRPPESRRAPGEPPFVSYMTLDIKPGLLEWRKKRKDKAQYQLQLELCEQALAKLREDRDVPEDRKEAPRRGIEAEAANLREAKRPSFRELGEIDLDLCTPAFAERCREEIEGKK
jgi:hypothetical protein